MHVVWYKILDCIFLKLNRRTMEIFFLKESYFTYEILIVSYGDHG